MWQFSNSPCRKGSAISLVFVLLFQLIPRPVSSAYAATRNEKFWHQNEIAYGLEGDIWLIDLNTARSERLTEDGNNQWPTWSDDGRYLLYTHQERVNQYEVRIFDMQRKLQIRTIADACCAVWVPDGNRIAYLSLSADELAIASTQLLRQRSRTLYAGLPKEYGRYPAGNLHWFYSEGSERFYIPLAKNRPATDLSPTEVNQVNARTVLQVDVTQQTITDLREQWSLPDDCTFLSAYAGSEPLLSQRTMVEFIGKRCGEYFAVGSAYQQGIYLADATGRRVTNIATAPDWSSDGHYLVYELYNNPAPASSDKNAGKMSRWGIGLYNVSTYALWPLIQDGTQPAWRPTPTQSAWSNSAVEVRRNELLGLFEFYRLLDATHNGENADFLQTYVARCLSELANLAQGKETRKFASMTSMSVEDVLSISADELNRLGKLDLLQLTELFLVAARNNSPLYFDHTLNLARLYWHLAESSSDEEQITDMFDKSLREYRKALQMHPKDSDVLNELGNLYLHRQEYQKAESAYRQSLTLNPRLAKSYTLLANLYEKEEAWTEMVALLQEGIPLVEGTATKSEMADLYLFIGVAYARLSETESAIEANLKALEWQPDRLLAMRNLALLYRSQGELALAQDWVKKALDLAHSPATTITATELGELEDLQTQIEQASEANQPSEVVEAKPGQAVKMVMIPKFVGLDVFEEAKQGAEDAAAELQNPEPLQFLGPSFREPVERQGEIMGDAVAEGVDAIMLSNNSGDGIVPVARRAKAKGITVVTWDSPIPSAVGEQLLIAQVDFSKTGQVMADMALQILGKAGGEIAILSAAQDAPNQNAWNAAFQQVLETQQYSKLQVVETVYGNDDAQVSYELALTLLKTHPDLKLIMAPTSVGIVAAAKAMQDIGLCDQVKVTGLGLPSELASYTKNGCVPKFALWDFHDLGYLTYYATYLLATGELEGKEGEQFVAGRLGLYTIMRDPTRQQGLRVMMGPFKIYDKDNVD